MIPADRLRLILSRFTLHRKPQNVWQWAEEFRWFAKRSTAEAMHGPVQYKTAKAPHQREPQESFTDLTVQTTVLVGASQTFGKTEIMNNLMGFCMDYEPRDQIMLRPTQESSEKFSKKKFIAMVRATPCLDALLPNSRSRDSGNTILLKEYVGGSIYFISSNSTSNLRAATADVLLADEIDDFPRSAGGEEDGEGDPVRLLFNRAEQFSNAIQVVASTPTIEGASAIWSWWESSDQRLWFAPCYHCGVRGVFKWSPRSMIKAGPSFFMEWPKGKPESAVLMCASCARPLDDRQRLDAYHAGQWQPTANFSGIRGYHMNFLYSPWPCKKGYINRLHQMATEWERAKAKGRESLKVIINTGITEPWKAQVENVPDKDGLLARCEPYPCEVPAGAVYLTIGVDTQKNYLEYEVKGWGISEESWGIQTAKLWGNPHTAEPWAKLREILTRTWRHESGALLRISCGLIDSGGQVDSQAFAEPVYKFVRTLQDRFIFASKGSSTIGAPLVVGSPQKSGILLQLIGTDVAKSTIYERLAMQSKGPGYCHFPKDPERGYVEEYFRQLTAEGVSLEGKKRVWVKLRDRNEGLDLAVLNHAAFAIRNVNLEAVARSIKPSPENGVEKPVRRVTTIKI